MVIEVREQLKEQRMYLDRFDKFGRLYLTTSWAHDPTVVEREYLDTVRTGKFTPNKFQVQPCTIRKETGVHSNTMCRRGLYYAYSGKLYGDYFGRDGMTRMFHAMPEFDQDTAEYCLARALAKSRQAEFEGGVFLAELGETLSFIRNPFSSLTRAFGKFTKAVHRRRSRGVPIGDAFADTWLAYRYALIPLIVDVQTALEVFRKKYTQKSGFIRFAEGVKVDQSSQGVTAMTQMDTFAVDFVWTKEVKVKYTAHTYWDKVVESDALFRARILGLHPSQLLGILWEATRFSFIVDWVLAVGDWLRAITPDVTLDYIGNCVTQKATIGVHATVANPRASGGVIEFEPGTYTYGSVSLVRGINTKPAVLPKLAPNVVRLKRVIDTLALLWRPITKQCKTARMSNVRK